VKVEQFAVGFGQAIASWRKGVGFRWGSSAKEHERILRDEKHGINTTDGTSIGETEYRLNWLPLGGYVKMLGQDDLNPNAQSNDPRAYNNKPISKRMVIVSAGVIMNVILAAGLFMVLFLYGFNVPPAVVPTIIPGSPAQQAGLHVGDRILYFNGNYQHDFTKISMNAALSEEGATIPMIVRRAENGKEEQLQIATGRDSSEAGFPFAGNRGARPGAAGAAGAGSEEGQARRLREERRVQGPAAGRNDRRNREASPCRSRSIGGLTARFRIRSADRSRSR
jgi:membrane-associated protease RseP (regulator of RpoE activity)